MRKLTAAQVGDRRVGSATRTPGRPVGRHIDMTQLHVARARDVPLPEPVTWRDLNGRQPEEWEEPYIRESRERERRAEAVLLAGTGGTP